MLHTASRAVANEGAVMGSPMAYQEHSTKAAMLQKTKQVNGHIDSIPQSIENDLHDDTNWIVQKFGGTSLGKFAVTIAEDIVLYVVAGHRRVLYRLNATGKASRNTKLPLYVQQGAP